MRRGSLALLLLGLVLHAGAGHTHADDEPRVVELQTSARVEQVRRVDVDGDGVGDLLLLGGREIAIFRGRTGTLPGTTPTRVTTLPVTASFADLGRTDDGLPALLSLGTEGLRVAPLTADRKPVTRALPGLAVPFADPDGATFVNLTSPDGARILLPTRRGYRVWLPPGEYMDVPLRVDQRVVPAGAFLEDAAEVILGWPRVHFGRSPVPGRGGPLDCLWAFSGEGLVAYGPGGATRYDLAFLHQGAEGGSVERRLVDLDADGRPDVLHQSHNGREARFGFFLTAPTKPASTEGAPAAGPSHRPARGHLHLAGYPLEPELVDLDGDGRLDFVITTMAVDTRNMVRAITAQQVEATTRAFLGRASTEGPLFRSEPDATITSLVEVRVRFTYAGTVDVKRNLTILTTGDHDGDGRRDLLIRTGPETLTLRRGLPQGVWEQEGRTIAIPSTAGTTRVDGLPADVTGDGKDEIVLVYHFGPGQPDRVVVLRAAP